MAADARGLTLATLSLVLFVLAAACQEEEEKPAPEGAQTPEVLPATPTASVDDSTLDNCLSISEPPQDDSHNPAQSLRRMVEWHPIIVAAAVQAEAGVYHLYGDIPYTIYDIRVTDVISGEGVSPGDHVRFVVPGGPRPDGCVTPLFGPITVGARYLLFLNDWRSLIPDFPGFGGEAAARFRISNGGLIVPNGFESYPGTREVSETTPENVNEALAAANPDLSLEALATVKLDGAITKIQAEIAEAPLPVWPPPWSALYQNSTLASSSPAPPTPTPTPASTSEPTSIPTPLASP